MFLGSMVIWGIFGTALIVGIIAAMDESAELNPAPWFWLAFVPLVAGIAVIAWWIRWLVRRGGNWTKSVWSRPASINLVNP